jgi:hypothetical protein
MLLVSRLKSSITIIQWCAEARHNLMVVSMFEGCSFIDSTEAVHTALITTVCDVSCALLCRATDMNAFHVTAQYPARLFLVLCWIMLHGFMLGCRICSIVSDAPAKRVSLVLSQLEIVYKVHNKNCIVLIIFSCVVLSFRALFITCFLLA